MCMQAILTAAAILCMCSEQILVVGGQFATGVQLMEIKDIICSLILSGTTTEHSDTDTVKELKKYNISLDNTYQKTILDNLCKLPTSENNTESELDKTHITRNNSKDNDTSVYKTEMKNNEDDPQRKNFEAPTIINLVTITNNHEPRNDKGITNIELQNAISLNSNNRSDINRDPEINSTFNKNNVKLNYAENETTTSVKNSNIGQRTGEIIAKYETIIKDIGKVLTKDQLNKIKTLLFNASGLESVQSTTLDPSSSQKLLSTYRKVGEKICADNIKCKAPIDINREYLKNRKSALAPPESEEVTEMAQLMTDKINEGGYERPADLSNPVSIKHFYGSNRPPDSETFLKKKLYSNIKYSIVENNKESTLSIVRARRIRVQKHRASPSHKQWYHTNYSNASMSKSLFPQLSQRKMYKSNPTEHDTMFPRSRVHHLPTYVHLIPRKSKYSKNSVSETLNIKHNTIPHHRNFVKLKSNNTITLINNKDEKQRKEIKSKTIHVLERPAPQIKNYHQKYNDSFTGINIQDIVRQVKTILLNDFVKTSTTTKAPTLGKEKNYELKNENKSDTNIVIPIPAATVLDMINLLKENLKSANVLKEKNMLFQLNMTSDIPQNISNNAHITRSQTQKPFTLPAFIQTNMNMIPPLQIPVDIRLGPYGDPNTFGNQKIFENQNAVQVSVTTLTNEKHASAPPPIDDDIQNQHDPTNNRQLPPNSKESRVTKINVNPHNGRGYAQLHTQRNKQVNHEEKSGKRIYNLDKHFRITTAPLVSKHNIHTEHPREHIFENEISFKHSPKIQKSFSNKISERDSTVENRLRNKNLREADEAPRFADTHFQNFLKTQEKVNNILEHLLMKQSLRTRVYTA